MSRKRPRKGNRLRCRMCWEAGKPDPWYDASEFYPIYRNPDGSPRTFDSYCKPCRIAYNHEYQQARYRYDPGFRTKHLRRNRKRRQVMKKNLAAELQARQAETQRLVRRLMELRWRQRDIAIEVGTDQHTVSDWSMGVLPRNDNHLRTLRRLVRETEDGAIAPPVRAHRAPSWIREAV